jgi:uncharacterized protein YcbK (DUF882 family)
MQLSEHFTLEELTASDIASRRGLNNSPSGEVVLNLKKLATALETIRKAIDKPITITSGYRSAEVNAWIGGSKTSQHCKGQAADIKVSGMTPHEVVEAIIKSGLHYDQLIREFDAWTHISISDTPRKMALIIDKKGTRPFK